MCRSCRYQLELAGQQLAGQQLEREMPSFTETPSPPVPGREAPSSTVSPAAPVQGTPHTAPVAPISEQFTPKTADEPVCKPKRYETTPCGTTRLVLLCSVLCLMSGFVTSGVIGSRLASKKQSCLIRPGQGSYHSSSGLLSSLPNLLPQTI